MQLEERTLSGSEIRWLACYFASSWLTNFGHGLVVTVVGPTQLYIAQNVGVEKDTINLLWTFGFFGYLVGSLATGFIFKKYFKTQMAKTSFLCVTMMINGLMMIVLPFLRNFGLLITCRCLQNLALGAFITADCSMVVYTLGPIKSRPFTMAVHSVIGIGFLAATFLVKPFLPEEKSQSESTESVCGVEPASITLNASSIDSSPPFTPTVGVSDETKDIIATNETLLGVDKIAWPYIISGVWCAVFSLGYAFLAISSFRMPCYYEESLEDNFESGTNRIKLWKPLLAITFFYYFFSCGIERIYQPMAYTYGLCGPLKLSPSEAVVTDQSYNGGFMAGRIASIFVSKVIRPRNMIFMSLITCVASAVALVAVGGASKYGLYAGTGFLGFFVSWQYGSCYSWVAQKGDISGRPASIFFIGCGAGSLVFPPLSGFVFSSSWWGPQGVLHLTLIACLLQCAVYSTMYFLSRKK